MTKQTQEQKSAIRKEVVAYLNHFNADHYPEIEPLLRKAKMDFFAISDAVAIPGEDACYTTDYYIVLGRKPQVAIYRCGGWTYPLVSKQEVFEVFDIGLGEIRLSRERKNVATVDVADTALRRVTWDYSNAVGEYKKRIEEDFPRYFDFLKKYVACREDKR